MARTNYLRELILTRLEGLKSGHGIRSIYYNTADTKAMYPHVVYDLSGSNIGDLHRKDYTLDIEIFTWKDTEKAEDIADAVEDLFLNRNDPQTNILPTFHLDARSEIEDPDKDIKRQLVRMTVQMYERTITT